MYLSITNSPVFSYTIKDNGTYPHFRCKIKLYKFGTGTILLAEAVNSPASDIYVRCEKESFSVKCNEGYGITAIYSPLSYDCFICCKFEALPKKISL